MPETRSSRLTIEPSSLCRRPRALAARLGLAAVVPLVIVLAATACGGSAPPRASAPPTPAEPEPSLGSEDDGSAVLEILAASPTEILLDGQSIGKTPISGYKVAPGSHDVTFVDGANGNRTMAVRLEPGESKVVQADPVPAASGALQPEPEPKKR
jgi:hypothetical protein